MRSLRPAERVVALVCLVYPFRLMLNALAGTDLHLGIVCFAAVGLVALATVRDRPRGFPNALDVGIAAYALLLLGDLFLLTGPTAQGVKGLSVEIRFAVFYFAARALGLRREFAVWLLVAMLVLATLAAVIGAVEFHFAWGKILQAVGGGFDSRFFKGGMARLYSFSMSPLAAAYLLMLGIAGAIGLAAEDRRPALVVLGVFCIWQAMPLTLARAAMTSAILSVVVFLVVDRRRAWPVAAASLASGAVAVAIFWARGWLTHQTSYAAATTRLADASSRAHVSSFDRGMDLLRDSPWGHGLGQAGHVAMARGGLYPFDDTYYVTLGVQIGYVGLAAFGIVLALALAFWIRAAVASGRGARGVAYAGLVIFASLAWGGLFVATWNMLVPQLYFWILTGAAANAAAKT